jgi:hypothetical protein
VLDYIQKRINQIKNSVEPKEEKENEHQQIEDIIAFRQEILKLCNECFKKNNLIINNTRLELQRSFAKVDEFPNKLAAYIDAFILKNGKNLENEEVTKQLNEIFAIIALTTERDRFLYYYEQTLSKLV